MEVFHGEKLNKLVNSYNLIRPKLIGLTFKLSGVLYVISTPILETNQDVVSTTKQVYTYITRKFCFRWY